MMPERIGYTTMEVPFPHPRGIPDRSQHDHRTCPACLAFVRTGGPERQRMARQYNTLVREKIRQSHARG